MHAFRESVDRHPAREATEDSADSEAIDRRARRAPLSDHAREPHRLSGDGVTKGDVVAYYEQVAERIAPYLAGRLVSIVSAPENIERETFFQRRPMKGMTAGVNAVGDGDERIYFDRGRAGTAHGRAVRRNRVSRLDEPVRQARSSRQDGDRSRSGAGRFIRRRQQAAREIADRLEAIGIESRPMITGGKGVHVVAPLDRTLTTEDVAAFAQAFAREFADRAPRRFIATMSKAKREGRMFIDWMRNSRSATSILPWSLRARAGAPVATPLSWQALNEIRPAPHTTSTAPCG